MDKQPTELPVRVDGATVDRWLHKIEVRTDHGLRINWNLAHDVLSISLSGEGEPPAGDVLLTAFFFYFVLFVSLFLCLFIRIVIVLFSGGILYFILLHTYIHVCMLLLLLFIIIVIICYHCWLFFAFAEYFGE